MWCRFTQGEEMRITKIRVQNFRLLKDITVDLQDNISVIIGKNNCGKTSLLLVMDKLLGSGSTKAAFAFDDFNVDFKEQIKSLVEGKKELADPPPFLGISLKIFVEYDDADDLSNIGNKVIMDLDPDNNQLVLAFEYQISPEMLGALKKDFNVYCDKKGKNKKDFDAFLRQDHGKYFRLRKKSVQYDREAGKENDLIFTDLVKEGISIDNIINFKWISARRNVSNKDSDKALSTMSARIYKHLEANNKTPEIIEDFKDALSTTDGQLDKIYSGIFKDIIEDVKKFGGIKKGDSDIHIISTLQHRDLLEANTTVMYGTNDQGHALPENYNGLGYMNLISIIFEINILLHEFQKTQTEKPADINLLFIEEPEAHTHPQMQAVFIKNIKALLGKAIKGQGDISRPLQTILTTHSAHIVSESDFEDIKYFKRDASGVTSKNLKDLKDAYKGEDHDDHYRFLKQYLTLHRAQLFFADKAILIEGDTERILLPAMMKKLDQKDQIREFETGSEASTPLLSQNISVIEVGAYSHIFSKFIEFIGMKSLIITDLDATKLEPKLNNTGEAEKKDNGEDKTHITSCRVSDGVNTANAALKYFFGGNSALSYFINLSAEEKRLQKNNAGAWEPHPDGYVMCCYQIAEDDANGVKYHAKSFEDAFFHVNREFIRSIVADNKGKAVSDSPFQSLTYKYLKCFLADGDAYELAMKGVKSKPSFAIEILLNSIVSEKKVKCEKSGDEKTFVVGNDNWQTPAYIEEGLTWIKQS
jgi:predicted ATP-dependent endonuclease of OLD family